MPENPVDAVTCGVRGLVSMTQPEGDREAEFARLVLCRQGRMLRTIWRVVRDPDLVDDTLQEALTTLWRKLPVLARHPNPEAFVLRVCLDAAYDHLRAHLRRRRRHEPLDASEEATSRMGPAAEPLVVLDEVHRAIGRLPRRQATAILLRAIHDESYETIAGVLGCSQVTARVHVTRAREKLRHWLSPLCGASREETSR